MVRSVPASVDQAPASFLCMKGIPVKRTFAPLIIALFLTSFLSADDKKEGKFDAAKMVGDWKIAEGVKTGEKVGEDHLKVKVKVTKETFILDGEMGKFIMAYKLNTSADPVTIDMDIKEGPIPEGHAIGIVWASGDDMKLCYVPDANGTRPAKFESTKDNGAFFWTLKRQPAVSGK
jgi:uncharacterized protein (TIGR03067 family)